MKDDFDDGIGLPEDELMGESPSADVPDAEIDVEVVEIIDVVPSSRQTAGGRPSRSSPARGAQRPAKRRVAKKPSKKVKKAAAPKKRGRKRAAKSARKAARKSPRRSGRPGKKKR